MDAKTEQMLVTMGAGLAKKVLMLQAAGLVSHGVMSSNYTEVFVSLGMAALGAGWSFWNDYGKVIFFSQLEVLKAKSLAQAAKLKDAGLPPVTVNQIAAQSPTMTPADVTKAVATLPATVQANVAPSTNVSKIVAVLAILALGAFAFPGDAMAQVKLKPPQITGDVINDTKANLGIGTVSTTAATTPSGTKLGDSGCKATGDPIADLHCVIKAGGAKLIVHLKQSYALASAPGAAPGSTTDNTSAMCTKAIVPIVSLVVNGPKSGTLAADDPMAFTADETALASNTSEPDGPIVIIEKLRILRLALQSPALNDACGALVQDEVKNAQSLVGKVTSLITGAGILAPIGL